MNFIRAFFRFTVFILASIGLISYFLITGIVRGYKLERGFRLRIRFIKLMLNVLNVKLSFYGKIPTAFQGFIIANHRSYFDPVAILNYVDAVTVTKSEVSKWPVVGLGAKLVGVIWVKRGEKDSRKAAREQMLELVKSRYNVLIFPEGTSSKSPVLLEVRNATFEMAAAANVPVMPVAIEYGNENDAWVGTDTFVRHFFECFGKKETKVAVYFSDPVLNSDAVELKQEVINSINAKLEFLRSELGRP